MAEATKRGTLRLRSEDYPYTYFSALDDPGRDTALQVLMESLLDQSWRTMLIVGCGAGATLAEFARRLQPPEAEIDIVECRCDGAETARLVIDSDPNARVDFSDFAFAPDRWYDRVLFRILKGKAAVHHVINRCVDLLAPGGVLHLAGRGDEGIKTYAAKAAALLGEAERTIMHRGSRAARIIRADDAPRGPLLPDEDYAQLRLMTVTAGGETLELLTKPGIAAWARVDDGTAMLARHLEVRRGADVIDLDCGYGLLSVLAARRGAGRITAVDANAAAVAAAAANLQRHGVDGEAVAGDAATLRGRRADLVLASPPFHPGFYYAHDPAAPFIRAAAALLKPDGRMLLAANSTFHYEPLVAAAFAATEVIEDDGRFKVIAGESPR